MLPSANLSSGPVSYTHALNVQICLALLSNQLKMSRCHGWTFTSFNTESEPVFDGEIHEYLIFGRETCPNTSRRHLQGYVYFKSRRRLPFLKSWIPQAHFEAAKGSPQQNKDYCSKDGDFTEHGRLPRSKSGGSAFKDVLTKAESGDIPGIKEEYPGIFLRYKTNILSSVKFRTEELTSSCGVWICGPPRCGKDWGVKKFGNCFLKPLNKWWDGYADEPHVLLSDIEPDHGKWLGYFLKIWADRYAFTAEVKGSTMRIRPRKIFCTSNFLLEEVFKDRVLEAIKARFNVFNEFDGSFIPRQADEIKTGVYERLLALEDGLAQENVPPVPSTSGIQETLGSSSDEFQTSSKPKKKKKRVQKSRASH